jgi:hypothetical protein
MSANTKKTQKQTNKQNQKRKRKKRKFIGGLITFLWQPFCATKQNKLKQDHPCSTMGSSNSNIFWER